MYAVFQSKQKVCVVDDGTDLNRKIREYLKMHDEQVESLEELMAEEPEVYQGRDGVTQEHCRRRDTRKWVDHEKKRNRRKATKQSRKKNRRK